MLRTMIDATIREFLAKAAESLASAESEYAQQRYNSCANRCCYACFQAAVVALVQAGIRPQSARGTWSHAFVQAQFAGQLIGRRKVYPALLRDTLHRLEVLREKADYELASVNQREAFHALERARTFVRNVQQSSGRGP